MKFKMKMRVKRSPYQQRSWLRTSFLSFWQSAAVQQDESTKKLFKQMNKSPWGWVLNTLGSNQKMSGKRKEKEKGRKEGKIFLKLKEEEKRKRKKEEKRRKEMEMEKEERVSERRKKNFGRSFVRDFYLPSFPFLSLLLFNHLWITQLQPWLVSSSLQFQKSFYWWVIVELQMYFHEFLFSFFAPWLHDLDFIEWSSI